MCDFPNFSTRSNNSRFSSISGVFSALGALRKVVDTVLESSTREDEVYDVRFPKFLNKVKYSIFSSISGVFSALGAGRKVVDTVLESSK